MKRAPESDDPGSQDKPPTQRDGALDLLAVAGQRGLTWRELAGATGTHHGQASGMLSNLHQRGMIARLGEKRLRCSVYVLHEHTGDRPTFPYGTPGNAAKPRAVVTADDAGVPSAELLAEVETLRAALRDKHTEVRELLDLSESNRAMAVQLRAEVDELRTRQADREKSAKRTAAETRRREADARTELITLRDEMEQAVAAAHEQGEEKGWTIGYDAGITAGRTESVGEEKARLLIDKGVEEGRLAEMAAIDKLAAQLIIEIKRNVPVRTHHPNCYQQHPECVLLTVRRNVAARASQLGNAGVEVDVPVKRRRAR